MASEILNFPSQMTSRWTGFSEVPVEIWQYIFRTVCADSLQEHLDPLSAMATQGRNLPLSVYFTPFTLSHVCRHWHDITTLQTSLWTNIFIHARTRAPDRLLKLWLTRTRSHLLHLWADVHEDHPSIPTCLKMVRHVNSRWKTISLQMSEAEWATQRKNLLNMDSELFPSRQEDREYAHLEVLEGALHCGLEDDQDEFISRFRQSESVHTLKLGECRHCIHPSSEYIPYPMNLFLLPSVVNLSLSSQFLFPLLRFLQTITDMPNLQYLELRNCTLNIPTSPVHRITIPHLRHLSIIDWKKNPEVRMFFACIDLPSLTSVVLTPTLHTPSFLQMVVLSKCNIQRLHVTTNHVSFQTLVSVLTSRPFRGLQEFHLDAPMIGNEVLRFFSDTDFEHDFKRTLSRITLRGCASDDGLLANLATSRMESGILRHLYAEVTNGLGNHPIDVEGMERLRRKGFDACLRAG